MNELQMPQEMLLPEAVTSIAAGSRHTLFLGESGDVWAVGSNSNGQLGLGSQIDCSPAPRRLPALAGLLLCQESCVNSRDTADYLVPMIQHSSVLKALEDGGRHEKTMYSEDAKVTFEAATACLSGGWSQIES